jgi:ATP-dependent Clp protease protease subunit
LPFWNFINNEAAPDDVELRIEGDIVSDDDTWLYEWLGMQCASPNAFREALKANEGKNINLWINSWGGDTTAAAGIFNALKEYKGKVTGKVEKAVSAASVIAMACTDLQMSPVGIMMVHNPWTGVTGEAKDMRHMANVLDQIKETIVNAYQMKTKRSRNKISQMMDEETWMGAKKAMSEGFIDGILYSEPDTQLESELNFSRLAIQNSVSESTRHFIEQFKKIESAKLSLSNEDPRPAPVDLYKLKIANNERRLKSYGISENA